MYIYIYTLVGGLEHLDYFSIYLGIIIIPTDFHIFQRGGSTTRAVHRAHRHQCQAEGSLRERDYIVEAGRGFGTHN